MAAWTLAAAVVGHSGAWLGGGAHSATVYALAHEPIGSPLLVLTALAWSS